MRIAIVSDIHGNVTAFDAVLADLRSLSPDLVLHGGDLADSGASPCAIVDRICAAGWRGVCGNTDEMLFRPSSLREYAAGSPGLTSLFDNIAEMAAWTVDELGSDRLAWLRRLPEQEVCEGFALVHASPGDRWRAPPPDAGDAILRVTYGTLGQPLVSYGHIHLPYIRSMDGLTVCNSGSVGLPYDGDPRASYLLIDDGRPAIRRVYYDREKELALLRASRMPHAGWMARTILSARPEMP